MKYIRIKPDENNRTHRDFVDFFSRQIKQTEPYSEVFKTLLKKDKSTEYVAIETDKLVQFVKKTDYDNFEFQFQLTEISEEDMINTIYINSMKNDVGKWGTQNRMREHLSKFVSAYAINDNRSNKTVFISAVDKKTNLIQQFYNKLPAHLVNHDTISNLGLTTYDYYDLSKDFNAKQKNFFLNKIVVSNTPIEMNDNIAKNMMKNLTVTDIFKTYLQQPNIKINDDMINYMLEKNFAQDEHNDLKVKKFEKLLGDFFNSSKEVQEKCILGIIEHETPEMKELVKQAIEFQTKATDLSNPIKLGIPKIIKRGYSLPTVAKTLQIPEADYRVLCLYAHMDKLITEKEFEKHCFSQELFDKCMALYPTFGIDKDKYMNLSTDEWALKIALNRMWDTLLAERTEDKIKKNDIKTGVQFYDRYNEFFEQAKKGKLFGVTEKVAKRQEKSVYKKLY